MKKSLMAIALIISPTLAHADVAVTLYGGKTFNQSLETTEAQEVNLDDSGHYAFSVDRTITGARYGLYYSHTKSDIDAEPGRSVDIGHLLFQSAVEYPVANKTSGYLGAQIGAAQIDPNWLSSDTYFASGLFTGVEYHFNEQMRLGMELRWLATIIDNNSQLDCTIGNDPNDQCLWHFDGDVLHQFNTSLAFSMRF